MGLTESHNSYSGPKPSSEFCALWRALVTPCHAEVTALCWKLFNHGPPAPCSAKTNPSSSPWGLASSWRGYAVLWCCSTLSEADRLTRQMVFGAGSSPRYRPSPRNEKMNTHFQLVHILVWWQGQLCCYHLKELGPRSITRTECYLLEPSNSYCARLGMRNAGQSSVLQILLSLLWQCREGVAFQCSEASSFKWQI